MKKAYGIKIQTEIIFKFMLKGRKTIKLIKESKNRRGLTQFFAYNQTRNIDVNKEIHAKKYCAVRSEHRIDKLNAKSIWKENLKVFITE